MVISWISIRLSVIERSQNVENNAFQIRLIKKSQYIQLRHPLLSIILGTDRLDLVLSEDSESRTLFLTLRAYLHEGGGPQVGQVTRLAVVEK